MGLVLAIAMVMAAGAAAPADCQSLLGPLWEEPEETSHAAAVDGASLRDATALIALRSAAEEGPLVVRGGDFSGADFREARLPNVCFLGTKLAGSDWRGADAPGVAFVRADLTGARLAGARMPRLLLRNAVLNDVDGAEADLSGGRFDGGWFDGSVENFRLDGASLRGFRFECGTTIDDGCPINQGGEPMSLRGADLSGANVPFWARLDGARIDRTEVSPLQLRDIEAARIEGPVIVVGGDVRVEISQDEYRSLFPHLADIEGMSETGEATTSQPPAWLRPGGTFFFADRALLFADDFRDDPLYHRLLPALVGHSSSMLAVRVRDDGSLEARGEAVGANGHSCSLFGAGLGLSAETGWYSGPQEAEDSDPAEWRGRPMPVLRFEGDRAWVYQFGKPSYLPNGGDPRSSGYASCGARAGFSEMVRIPITPADEEQWWVRLEESVD